ncbi:MAG: hypothetical protein FWC60_09820 [Firmicutes bacterium]|nr:hypothetical protein [Bacillota bacterium]
MNDIWYLGEGVWTAYTEDMQTALDFASIPDIKHVTTYYNSRGQKKALQFKFFQGADLRPGHCLLHYACRSLELDFDRVLSLALRQPNVSYQVAFDGISYQPDMFPLYNDFEPRRKKKRKKDHS